MTNKEGQEFLHEEISYTDKDNNLPNIPQLCPIESFWSVPKQKVHENNWKTDDDSKLVWRIKKCAKEMNPFVYTFSRAQS